MPSIISRIGSSPVFLRPPFSSIVFLLFMSRFSARAVQTPHSMYLAQYQSVDCRTGTVRERYAPTPHNIRMCTVGARKGDKPCELGRAKSLRRAPFGLLLSFLRINWRCNRHKKRQNQKDDRSPRRPPRACLHDVRIGRWTFALRELRDHPRHTTPHFDSRYGKYK
jgi:hypothetical protein